MPGRDFYFTCSMIWKADGWIRGKETHKQIQGGQESTVILAFLSVEKGPLFLMRRKII